MLLKTYKELSINRVLGIKKPAFAGFISKLRFFLDRLIHQDDYLPAA